VAQQSPAKQEPGLRKPGNSNPSIPKKNALQPQNHKRGKPNMNMQKLFTNPSSVNKSGNHI